MRQIPVRLLTLSILAVAALLTVGPGSSGGAAVAGPPRPMANLAGPAGIDPWIWQQLNRADEVEFLLVLREQADLSLAPTLADKVARGTYVYQRLSRLAERSQAPVRAYLDQLGLAYRPYWVANMIWVRGDRQAVLALAQRPDVAHLYANPPVPFDHPSRASDYRARSDSTAKAAIEWNISLVRAPDVWAMGITGQGAVIGGQDTGYDWDHPALLAQYRGWNGATADHNYNWHDAILSGGGSCGPNSPEPCDDHNHGTHTMGTMIGDDGGANQIGMAPGATWIGCRNMDVGVGTPATYSDCFQWFIAPTDLNGDNPDPARAPHVINNSWSCPPSEGCTDPGILLTVVSNVRAAGILVVVSAGNAGSACSSVNTPPAIYDESFTVASTTAADTVSSFSSRGPVTIDGSGRRKPDIAAPGSSVRSSIRNGLYGTFSGTSMAGPHVAGLAALLIDAEPSLAGDVERLEAIMTLTAVHLASGQACGGIPGSLFPNNIVGFGRIDALTAVGAQLAHQVLPLVVQP